MAGSHMGFLPGFMCDNFFSLLSQTISRMSHVVAGITTFCDCLRFHYDCVATYCDIPCDILRHPANNITTVCDFHKRLSSWNSTSNFTSFIFVLNFGLFRSKNVFYCSKKLAKKLVCSVRLFMSRNKYCYTSSNRRKDREADKRFQEAETFMLGETLAP